MNALRLSAAAVVAMASGAVCAVGCGNPPISPTWVCRDPATGMLIAGDFDLNHYVNGVFDPCHCLDPGGPLPTCDMMDAGADVMDAGAD